MQLDKFITLHQQKHEKLINVKKALLDRMFPKDGEVIPSLRFKGFAELWGQYEAKELCSITTGKSNSQDQVHDGVYPFYIRSETPVRSNKYLFDEEAVLTIGDGLIGKVFFYVNGKFDLHQRCYKISEFSNVTGKYFYYYFSNYFYSRAMKLTAKATVDSVRLEMISEMEIKLPNDKTEQNKISLLLTSIDSLITLHQQKHEKLINVKKALLQKMFV
jgi:type I restriction enzyme S subunit